MTAEALSLQRPVIGITTGLITANRERIRIPLPYSEAVIQGGGLPFLLPVSERTDLASAMLDHIDGLLISGGPDIAAERYGRARHPETTPADPRRTAIELALLAEAERRDMPVLGICGGIQLMNVARGGDLVQHLESDLCHRTEDHIVEDAMHCVAVAPNTRLAEIMGPGTHDVNSCHHQGLARVADSLAVTARAADGLVEGLEDPRLAFHLGVQWHPERIMERQHSVRLFEGFVRAASLYAR